MIFIQCYYKISFDTRPMKFVLNFAHCDDTPQKKFLTTSLLSLCHKNLSWFNLRFLLHNFWPFIFESCFCHSIFDTWQPKLLHDKDGKFKSLPPPKKNISGSIAERSRVSFCSDSGRGPEFKSQQGWLLCISNSQRVLRTPFAG